KTACPVVWEGDGAQSPSLDPIKNACPTRTHNHLRQSHPVGGRQHPRWTSGPAVWMHNQADEEVGL
ncbi:MAG TPA: hypothetical protein VGV35_20175, partial [Bryobacteraceae bacterium]|nr:hypothetical protein [Bryobacteraceae bacterium]